MRAILVGSEREREVLRWRLQGTGVAVVGEFDTLGAATGAGLDADALLLAPASASASTRELSRRGRGANARGGDGGGGADEVEPLTPREIDVLQLLAEGLPNKSIAEALGISDQTVKFHVAQITGKLGAANRTEAVRRALRKGMLAV